MSIDVWVDGHLEVEDAPHINLANGNFATMAMALGFYDVVQREEYVIPLDRLPELRRRIIELRSRSGAIGQHVRPEYIDATPGRATIIDVGANADYVAMRLEDFDRIFAFAQQRGRCVLYG